MTKSSEDKPRLHMHTTPTNSDQQRTDHISSAKPSKQLSDIIKHISTIPLLARTEYDFKYGNGSINNAYDIVKLKAIEKRAYKSAEAAIKSLWLDMVGKDELEVELKPYGNSSIGTVLGRNVERNQLRAELRAKIKES